MSVLTMLPLSLSTALAQCFSVSGMHIRNGLPDVVSYVRRPSLCLLWNEMHIRNGLPDVVSYVRRPSLCLLLNEMHIRNGSPDVVSYVRTKKHRMTCFVRKFWHANQWTKIHLFINDYLRKPQYQPFRMYNNVLLCDNLSLITFRIRKKWPIGWHTALMQQKRAVS